MAKKQKSSKSIKGVRYFNGNRYVRSEGVWTKAEVEGAKLTFKKGFFTRVIKVKGGYAIYYRPKLS